MRDAQSVICRPDTLVPLMDRVLQTSQAPHWDRWWWRDVVPWLLPSHCECRRWRGSTCLEIPANHTCNFNPHQSISSGHPRGRCLIYRMPPFSIENHWNLQSWGHLLRASLPNQRWRSKACHSLRRPRRCRSLVTPRRNKKFNRQKKLG